METMIFDKICLYISHSFQVNAEFIRCGWFSDYKCVITEWLKESIFVYMAAYSFIPLFHTGHETRESPRIGFLLIRGDL